MWRVMTQDAICYFGQLAEDFDDPGEVYETRDEALEAAVDHLREVFRTERTEDGVDLRALSALWQDSRETLLEEGAVNLTLPLHEGEEDGAFRYIAVAVESDDATGDLTAASAPDVEES